jgi:hypothetical protein
MVISPTDFLYNGILFYRNPDTGRCYRLAEPGSHSKAARKGLLASKRVSLAQYNESLAACLRSMEGGAA